MGPQPQGHTPGHGNGSQVDAPVAGQPAEWHGPLAGGLMAAMPALSGPSIMVPTGSAAAWLATGMTSVGRPSLAASPCVSLTVVMHQVAALAPASQEPKIRPTSSRPTSAALPIEEPTPRPTSSSAWSGWRGWSSWFWGWARSRRWSDDKYEWKTGDSNEGDRAWTLALKDLCQPTHIEAQNRFRS